MIRRAGLCLLIFCMVLCAPLWSQGFYPGHDLEVLRGEVRIDVEPIYGGFIEQEYPLPVETLRRRALEEAAMFYSAMIYGWSFHYDIGERARGIAEEFELGPPPGLAGDPLGLIPWGDRNLHATDVELRNQQLCLWTDYRLNEGQIRRAAVWRADQVRGVQARGRGPLGMPDPAAQDGENGIAALSWLGYKQETIRDAARSAVRTMLRGSERNRPKEARGFIALAEFPVFGIEAGRWTVFARFRVDITEIIPFASY
ncbi:MAG: hypothetical protein LBQ46_08035 [Treponema sp.]|jgi:hypothetical protein|nr:hypothetical protein [Treponema sp.]